LNFQLSKSGKKAPIELQTECAAFGVGTYGAQDAEELKEGFVSDELPPYRLHNPFTPEIWIKALPSRLLATENYDQCRVFSLSIRIDQVHKDVHRPCESP
jgi:hypothetical protein